jgi:hypothetical protein
VDPVSISVRPGHWTAHLHTLGVDVTGVDVVPDFIAHAADAPRPTFLLAR